MGESHCVTLVGLKHVGKSSVARALVQVVPEAVLVDLDEEMVRLAREEGWFIPGSGSGAGADPPIRALYRYLGVQAFISWETAVLRGVIAHDRPCRVLATGGGICDNRDAMVLLEQARPILYLRDEPAVLYHRFIRRGIPAFLDPTDPWGSFLRIVNRRDRLYRDAADHVISVTGRSIEETVRDILDLVR